MRVVCVLCAFCALTFGVAVAFAGGGNSANAKLCQKDGWMGLVGSDGTTFASEEACVAFAAQGGTLTQKTRSQIDCENAGGTFTAPGPNGQLWTCGPLAFDFDVADALANDCVNDGGVNGFTWSIRDGLYRCL
jgi:hypothetical protein